MRLHILINTNFYRYRCLSAPFRCFVQMNEDYTTVQFSASDRTIILVSGEVKFIRIFTGDHPQ